MAAVQNGTNGIVEDGGTRFKPEPSTGLMRFMDIVNTITHLSLGGVAFTVIFFAIYFNSISDKLSQHMILCVLGYVILMAQSILVMSPSNGWSRTIRYQDRKIVHLAMHIIGAVLALSGSFIMMFEKDTNFNTTHGILGLVALIFTIFSLIGGVVHLYTCMPRITCLLHCVFGALTMVMAFISLIYGIDTVFRPLYENDSTNTLIALTVIGLVGTLLPSCFKLQKGCL